MCAARAKATVGKVTYTSTKHFLVTFSVTFFLMGQFHCIEAFPSHCNISITRSLGKAAQHSLIKRQVSQDPITKTSLATAPLSSLKILLVD